MANFLIVKWGRKNVFSIPNKSDKKKKFPEARIDSRKLHEKI